MAYKLADFENDQKQQMHSILDRGFNNMRQSFDRGSNSNHSMSSSRQSPSLRKKSELRRVLDEMKSETSSVASYADNVQYGFYNQVLQNAAPHNNYSHSNVNIPPESPLKKERVEKKAEMQNEIALLQK
jgi:hypothetical protein